jgi:hypothetical protein
MKPWCKLYLVWSKAEPPRSDVRREQRDIVRLPISALPLRPSEGNLGFSYGILRKMSRTNIQIFNYWLFDINTGPDPSLFPGCDLLMRAMLVRRGPSKSRGHNAGQGPGGCTNASNGPYPWRASCRSVGGMILLGFYVSSSKACFRRVSPFSRVSVDVAKQMRKCFSPPAPNSVPLRTRIPLVKRYSLIFWLVRACS